MVSPSIPGLPPNHLATRKERSRLFAGLEAFVNAGDSLEDYQALAVLWPTFWPHGIADRETGLSLNWCVSAHPLFLDYRDKLRNLWTGDPEVQLSPVLAYLLGIIGPDDFVQFEYTLDVDPAWIERKQKALHEACEKLPQATITGHSMAFPLWGSADLHYVYKTEFEHALWLLSKESWRARVCVQCKRYFIADKPAQRHCSTRCSGEAKRQQERSWWERFGKQRRRAKQAMRAARQANASRGARHGPANKHGARGTRRATEGRVGAVGRRDSQVEAKPKVHR